MANTTGNKYGGREKGTPNRLTKELRTLLKDILYQELEQIQERLELLKPKERLELLIKLIPYVLPKVTSVSHTTNELLDCGIRIYITPNINISSALRPTLIHIFLLYSLIAPFNVNNLIKAQKPNPPRVI